MERSDENSGFILGREGETEYQLGRLSVKVRSYKERVSLQGLTWGREGSGRGGWQEKEGATCGKLHQVGYEDRKPSACYETPFLSL